MGALLACPPALGLALPRETHHPQGRRTIIHALEVHVGIPQRVLRDLVARDGHQRHWPCCKGLYQVVLLHVLAEVCVKNGEKQRWVGSEGGAVPQQSKGESNAPPT